MSVRVYQCSLRPPTGNEALIREQLRAAHDYRNDLVAIERGRRHALRAIDDASDDVARCKEVVRGATRSTRKTAVRELSAARKRARAAAGDELALIAAREHEILLSARANTAAFWGSYLDIEAAHRQSRSQPLYSTDALAPNDPAFVAGPRWRDALGVDDVRAIWWRHHGQLGIQIQGGMTVAELLGGEDTRARLALREPSCRGERWGTLQIRIGSEGRSPIWGEWPVYMHRALPGAARVKWIRVSVTPLAHHERWSCEITVDDPNEDVRSVYAPPRGVVAIEWEWTPLENGSIRVARWTDGGEVQSVTLPPHILGRAKHAGGIRALRDLMRNQLVTDLQRTKDRGTGPRYLVEAINICHLWRSPQRFESLLRRLELDGVTGSAVALLRRWYYGDDHECRHRRCRAWHGDRHLYEYETRERRRAIHQRRDIYRQLAATWRSRYRTVILSDQDLSYAARFGDDSDVRFVAGVSELRQALRNAFGADAIDARWRDGADEEDERAWCERSLGRWIAGGARGDGMFAADKAKTENAWRKRKAKKSAGELGEQTARESSRNAAE
ncbi:MAG: hypothetical protein KF782_13805 [Labilithrix sp.]|nr:hypothetical protein [Labilithrix sp.]